MTFPILRSLLGLDRSAYMYRGSRETWEAKKKRPPPPKYVKPSQRVYQ